MRLSAPLTQALMRWGVLAGIIGSVGLAAALYVLLAGWVHENTCYELLPPSPESVRLVVREAPELMDALNSEYASSNATISGLPALVGDALPKPLRVVFISGKTATVELAGPASDTNYMYAAAWAQVWGAHHGKPASSVETLPCVNLNERWDGGGITMQPYPAFYL